MFEKLSRMWKTTSIANKIKLKLYKAFVIPVLIHSFIHSFRPFLYRPFKSSTTQRRSRLQHGYCIGVSRRSAQATAGKGLAHGPYMAARAGVEPTTLRLRVIASTNAPPCPTKYNVGLHYNRLAASCDVSFHSPFTKSPEFDEKTHYRA